MESKVDLLEGLSGLGLGALEDSKGVVTLQVVVLRATVTEEQRDYGGSQYGCA
jgi:hypothetical protein